MIEEDAGILAASKAVDVLQVINHCVNSRLLKALSSSVNVLLVDCVRLCPHHLMC